MKYAVSITETLRRTVPIEAESLFEAEDIIKNKYRASEIILSSDDFVYPPDFEAWTLDDKEFDMLTKLSPI